MTRSSSRASTTVVPEALALIGGTGLLILIWLMTVKPG